MSSQDNEVNEIVAKCYALEMQGKKCANCFKNGTGCEEVSLRMTLVEQFGVCHRYEG